MSGKYWVSEPDGYLEPRVSSQGYGAQPPKTLIEAFKSTVGKFPERIALYQKRAVNGQLPSEYNRTWTWRQYYDDSSRFAKSLVKLDVKNFKIVNVIGFNSPEWFISCMGSILAGSIAAGIYSTNMPDACRYISDHSKAEVVVVEDDKQLAKYASMASTLPHLKAIVSWADSFDAKLAEKCGVPVYLWADFLKLGDDVPLSALDERQSVVRPGNCCSLIYTSGTTGPPKAVMISHDNATWTVGNVLDEIAKVTHEDVFVSFLPLSHIAAQLIDIFNPVSSGASVYFAQPDALKGTLTVTLKEARPTIFFGVPRVWEKIQEKMVQLGRETTGIKKQISTWAKSTGTEYTKRCQFGAGGGAPWGFGCANSLVFSKIKEALGLDRCRGCFTAAAPIAPETLWYFGSLNIPIYEVFGQSECTGPHTVSFKNIWKIGYCGRPMSGTVTKIDPINGELIYKGRHIFMGYMYMPEKTAETIDDEGYLHSGDVAEFDNNDVPDIPKPSGFMKITGRIKELIITAGGENIPPVLIENEVKAAMVAISNAMLIGDRRKFLSIVLTLKTDVDTETGLPTETLAKDCVFVGNQIGSSARTVKEAKSDPLWVKYINDGIKVANSKTTSNAQIIQKWTILDTDFSERGGELTPTLKLKRSVAAEKYKNEIEAMYVGSE